MKKLILAMILCASGSVWANALASIYNGKQFDLNGRFLVQDADHPDDYYVMPQTFTVKTKDSIDSKTGMPVETSDVNHRVQTIDGHEYSVYTIRLELDTPGQLEILKAKNRLQRLAGPNARIRGMAPICGMNVGIPASEPQKSETGARPDATLIRYAIRSTGVNCDSVITNTDFNLEIYAPIEKEPQIAQDMMSETGLVVPTLELVLPYKYKNHVHVWVNTHSTYEQLKGSVGLKGGFEYISGSVSGNMTKLFQRLDQTAGLDVDCQGTDDQVCAQFIKQAQDIIASRVLKYTPVADGSGPADSKSLIVGDKDKTAASMVQVDFAVDQATAEKEEFLKVDFSKSIYASVKTQAFLDISNVSPSVFDKRVRDMLKEQN